MSVVKYPDLRNEERLVDVEQFVDAVAARFPFAFQRPAVAAVVHRVTDWLHTVMRQAVSDERDVARAVLDVSDTAVAPSPLERFVRHHILKTTLREIPFWGLNPVRRANHVFAVAYAPYGAAGRPRRHRRVRFVDDSPTLT